MPLHREADVAANREMALPKVAKVDRDFLLVEETTAETVVAMETLVAMASP
jgi:hypothetical protein